MEEEKGEEFLKMLGAEGTMRILKFLDQHSRGRYKHMKEFSNTHTLNRRLKQLMSFGMVRHHLDKTEARTEWYELTERGRKALQYARELLEVVREPL